MNKEQVLTQESFDRFLAWLDPDRERAGARYEEIRRRLIKIFACRGCHVPEELADETINRVIGKASEVAADYTGDPALYFYGVAHKIHLEYLRQKPDPPSSSPSTPPSLLIHPADEVEQEYECLERCLRTLTESDRELVLDYCREEKGARIERRKQLARRRGIALNALRIRAHRIRETLHQCTLDCLGRRRAG